MRASDTSASSSSASFDEPASRAGGPPSQPVKSGNGSGAWVHQVGTLSSLTIKPVLALNDSQKGLGKLQQEFCNGSITNFIHRLLKTVDRGFKF